jgi:hypothetical protein
MEKILLIQVLVYWRRLNPIGVAGEARCALSRLIGMKSSAEPVRVFGGRFALQRTRHPRGFEVRPEPDGSELMAAEP